MTTAAEDCFRKVRREVREAARQVNAYIQRARARALELGRPVGVVIRRSDSNPDIAYLGQPTGVPFNQPNSAHNALSINQAAVVVSNFRPWTAVITSPG